MEIIIGNKYSSLYIYSGIEIQSESHIETEIHPNKTEPSWPPNYVSHLKIPRYGIVYTLQNDISHQQSDISYHR